MIDQAACGLARTAENGLFLWVNRTFCDWVGYSAPDLVGRKTMQDLLTMGGRIFHQTHWAPLLQMQGSLSEVKLEVRHSDGETVIPMVMNAIRREQNGIVVHDLAAFVARDRDTYEKELLLSRRKLETLVAEITQLHAQAKDRALFAEQMVGIVSHDLRNPLSTIQMGAAVLARGHLDAAQMKMLDRVTRATSRATRMIADLLDFTQARLGNGITVTPRSINLHTAVAEAVEELSLAFPERTIVHERLGEGGCNADADRLAQLVGNLVANAVAYGRPDTPVTVTSHAQPASCSVTVHNHGDPIAPALQTTLFQPMVRGAPNAESTRSVGLGLFIVSEIARAHGGAVSVESDAESGTRFQADIPVVR